MTSYMFKHPVPILISSYDKRSRGTGEQLCMKILIGVFISNKSHDDLVDATVVHQCRTRLNKAKRFVSVYKSTDPNKLKC